MLELIAKEDTKTPFSGTAFRFIIGKPGGDVSGAIYIKADVPIPDSILLTVKKGE